MPLPTWRLAALIAVAALVVFVPVFTPGAMLVVAEVLILVLALVDAARAPRPDRVGVERDLPPVVGLESNATITWTVTNPVGRPLRVGIADELAPSLRPERRRTALEIAPHGRARARTRIRPGRRGRFTPTEVTVRVEGPLGLAARQRSRELPGVLRVYPSFHSRKEAELRIEKARILEVGLRSAKGRGGGTEFDQLRDYQADDQFRHIDWSATARRGKAIVRTYRAERNQTVITLLDSGRVMAGLVEGGEGIGIIPRLDHAMDAVLALTTVATRLGDRAGLVAFADRVRSVVPASGSRGQLTRVSEAMYALEPELVESNYRGAFTETIARFRRRAMLVVLTELVPEAVEETLLPALPLVVRDHVVVVAGVRDPDVERWARAVPAEAGTAYRKAAAVRALDARARIVARMRGMGAAVVDAVPRRLAPELADVYLRVKATGQL